MKLALIFPVLLVCCPTLKQKKWQKPGSSLESWPPMSLAQTHTLSFNSSTRPWKNPSVILHQHNGPVVLEVPANHKLAMLVNIAKHKKLMWATTNQRLHLGCPIMHLKKTWIHCWIFPRYFRIFFKMYFLTLWYLFSL